MKKMYLRDANKKLLGVIAGVADYFSVDPTVLRVFWILMVVFTGFLPGALVYFFAYLIMPADPETKISVPNRGEQQPSAPSS